MTLIEHPGTLDVDAHTGNDPLTDSEAANRLGLKVATLRAWRHQGRGPAFVRLGRAVRYLPSDLDAFLHANRQAPRSGNAVV